MGKIVDRVDRWQMELGSGLVKNRDPSKNARASRERQGLRSRAALAVDQGKPFQAYARCLR